jgi:hypothetical protein
VGDSRGGHPVHVLRQWLRQRRNAIGPRDTADEHRLQVERIWLEALRLAQGRVPRALDIAFKAVKSRRQPGESSAEHQARQGGLPSAVFGPAASTYGGVDKLQHFFGAARLAHAWGAATARWAGRAWESLDQLRKMIGRKPVGYDLGDVYADDLGAEFGRAVRRSPTTSIRFFTRPHRAAPGAAAGPFAASRSRRAGAVTGRLPGRRRVRCHRDDRRPRPRGRCGLRRISRAWRTLRNRWPRPPR